MAKDKTNIQNKEITFYTLTLNQCKRQKYCAIRARKFFSCFKNGEKKTETNKRNLRPKASLKRSSLILAVFQNIPCPVDFREPKDYRQ